MGHRVRREASIYVGKPESEFAPFLPLLRGAIENRMNLLLIDGSNIVMRCAFGGDVAPEPAAKVATGMVIRAGRELGASHLVLALDCPGVPSWRKKLFADYKANRTVDTFPWLKAAAEMWLRLGWWVEAVDGYEADDLLATIATRAANRASVMVLSGDSDVLPLMAPAIRIIKPENGGKFCELTPATVREKYGVAAGQLPELKAMTGETGDNVPGVEGIGPVRALALLNAHETLEGVIAAGGRDVCKFSRRVADQAETARLCLKLVTLVKDAPVVPIVPSGCVFRPE